jgi:hypothetical protein
MFNKLFPITVPFKRYVEKYGRAREDTDDNMAHEQCMLDN